MNHDLPAELYIDRFLIYAKKKRKSMTCLMISIPVLEVPF